MSVPLIMIQGCTRCGTLNRDARHPACTQVPVQPVALAPKCRCMMVQSRALHLRCKVQLGASAPHLGACTIRSPVARTYSSTGKLEMRAAVCLQCVWMGWSPSRKLMNAIGKSFWKPRHIAPSDQPAARPRTTHRAGTRARGRQLRWKPLTRASDHALKLPVSPQVLAALWSLAL